MEAQRAAFLGGGARGAVGDATERLQELGTAVGVAAVVGGRNAQIHVVGAHDLRVAGGEAEKDEVARRYARSGHTAADLLVGPVERHRDRISSIPSLSWLPWQFPDMLNALSIMVLPDQLRLS